YKPTNVGAGDPFASPASTSLLGTTLAVFNGHVANGTWSLYVVDDTSLDTGQMGGWSLNLTANTPICCGDVVSPAITTHPQSQLVAYGGSATFSVTASGS